MIAGSQVTDAGLPKLEGMKKLTSLGLQQTKTTPEGRKALKEKIKDLYIYD